MYNSNLKYLLSDDVNTVIKPKHINKRKNIFPILHFIAKKIDPYQEIIVRKENLPKDKPVIFTPNHYFKDDILASMIVAEEQFYLLFGNIDHLLHTFDGQLMNLFGVIPVDLSDKSSRKAALPKLIRALNLGANVMIFPEGSWNFTENELINKLYGGFYKVAKATGAHIVPIIHHTEDKVRYSIRDEAFDVTKISHNDLISIIKLMKSTNEKMLDLLIYDDANSLELKSELSELLSLIEVYTSQLITVLQDYSISVKIEANFSDLHTNLTKPVIKQALVIEDKVKKILKDYMVAEATNLGLDYQLLITKQLFDLQTLLENNLNYSIIKRISHLLRLLIDAPEAIAKNNLRDRMVRAKFELLQYATKNAINKPFLRYGSTDYCYQRSELEKTTSLKAQWEADLASKKAEVPDWNEELETSYPFKDPTIVSEQEVFAPIASLRNILVKK